MEQKVFTAKNYELLLGPEETGDPNERGLATLGKIK